MLVHVKTEGAVRVDGGPEKRGRAAPLLVGQLLRSRRFGQGLLHQQGVDVHERGLEPVQGEHRSLGVLRTIAPKAAGHLTWAEERPSGRRRNLSYEEEEAFWAFAVIEVLRLTGVRNEELLELTHHSVTQYRLPSTGEVVPLLQIAPSKTDTERLVLVSPELADVLSAIISRLRRPSGMVPLVAAYDVREKASGYKAVYSTETIEAHRAFIARRRASRPGEEYRIPTEEEWDAFLSHFEKRKVSIGTCARAFGSPCIHEHACLRCSPLWPDPAQRSRLTDIRDNLIARIAEAEREGWLDEVEGLQVGLTGAQGKLDQLDAEAARRPSAVDLGMPTFADVAIRTTTTSTDQHRP
ncbi:hypothetical protein [Streptomyces sp. NPDC048111]|uniref:hypothetical protein n=1 Tax=Streptomyces sp. NPDC048111 TaxID=3365500 RepID=UPI003715BC20